MRRRIFSISALSALALTGLNYPALAYGRNTPYSQRDEVQKFIKIVSNRHGIEARWIASVIDQATYQSRIERLMTPPKTVPGKKISSRDWNRYRSNFLGSYRISLGINFWKLHRDLLERAKREYGVDPAVIVGILGVETRYGENTGSWKVLDALVTLSFDYTRRADFFRKELESFLVIVYQNKLDPEEILGSYAGAIGLPQFMPSSIGRFGVDFDGDGQINIHRSFADAVGSIANYLLKNGWQADLPMILNADISLRVAQKYGGGRSARFTLAQLQSSGVRFHPSNTRLSPETRVFVADFPYYPSGSKESRTLYRLVTSNFATVLRYNASYFYAGAVAELGSTIAKRLNQPGLIG
ncbi:MAG: lytic murein transglycosylase B [Burkholderiaceae bacterium]|nr:lytic murein transglycosylase B [Burkholderiaceae bacterium]